MPVRDPAHRLQGITGASKEEAQAGEMGTGSPDTRTCGVATRETAPLSWECHPCLKRRFKCPTHDCLTYFSVSLRAGYYHPNLQMRN